MTDLELELVSYDDSWFTNAHDVVSHAPVHDGRGTFTHLGVKMEGIESARHINFKQVEEDGMLMFTREEAIVNNVEIALKQPTRALVQSLIFDTSFYTRNNVRDMHSVILVDDLEGKEFQVVKSLQLAGDSVKRIDLDAPVACTRVKLRMGEGGLARFKLIGTPTTPLPTPRNILRGAKVFWGSDESYGATSLALREEREGKIMAGWESRRLSARHIMAVELENSTKTQYQGTKVMVDTYMHCLNSFRYTCILAGNFQEETSANLLKSLPSWKVKLADGKTITVEDAQINEFWDTKDSRDAKYALDPAYNGPWKILLPMTPLKRDTRNEFTLNSSIAFTHLVFVGIPDGGVHRLVMYGDVVRN